MLERLEGVEPSSLAWEARVMPLYDTRPMTAGGGFYISAVAIWSSSRHLIASATTASAAASIATAVATTVAAAVT